MMPTFPKALSKFREIVEERGQRLRELLFQQLQRLGDAPVEHLTVDSRPATIGIIVQPLQSGGIRVVVQGFLKAKLLARMSPLTVFTNIPTRPSRRCEAMNSMSLTDRVWR